jgi:[protein-PII] uridylyltransferase
VTTVRLVRKQLFDQDAFQNSCSDSGNPLVEFKQTLANGRTLLQEFHLEGGPSAQLVEHHSWLIDQLILQCWGFISKQFPTSQNCSLLAVGGYGRGELQPFSDIDLLLIFERQTDDSSNRFAEHLIRFLWDMGLEVGHSVRTLKDCVRESKQDITVLTNLMEGRFLIGDEELLVQMQKRLAPASIWPTKKYYTHKMQEQLDRHARFNDTAYNLEPHIKEGPGGLRDIQMIVWMAQRCYGVGNLAELVDRGIVDEAEHRSLIRCRNFLWRLRNGLHFLANRREDRLLFDFQREIAREFGYQDKPQELAVEQLMKRYYRTVKELQLLNQILLQDFQAAIPSRISKKTVTINRRFKTVDGFLKVQSENVFKNSPYSLLELFLIYQQQTELKGISAQTIRLVRNNLHLINADFRKDIKSRSIFTEIFRQSRRLTHTLRRMNEYGVLGAYVPEFGRVVGQMQHDLFHVYTVDAHLLFVVGHLRRFALAKHSHEFPVLSEILDSLFKPYRLYLSGLFHDVAKGRGGDHSVLGEKDAFQFCKRHDLSDYDARFVAWLVRQHLVMSWTAQKQDISDPDVIARFAELVGDQEHLDNLYLLTVADIRSTGPEVWNNWKGQLLFDLYRATSRALRLGMGVPINQEQRVLEIKQESLKLLGSSARNRKPVEDLWSLLEDDYFTRSDPDTIRWHAESLINSRAGEIPLVEVRHRPRLEALQIFVFAPSTRELFSKVAGAFERSNLSIADARVHQMHSGMVLMAFLVLVNPSIETRSAALDILSRNLRKNILYPPQRNSALPRWRTRALKHFPIKTITSVNNQSNRSYSTLELISQDRPGLLYAVAVVLLECKVELISARISTFGERAEDIFIITNRDGQPITAAEQIQCIESRIGEVLDHVATAKSRGAA